MENQNEEVVAVQTPEDFFTILSLWHAKQLATVEHMSNVPEGSEVQLDDGAPITLEGDTHKAFVAGMMTAVQLFKELPFSLIDAPEEQPA